jgi:hypothetical protein
VLPNTRNGGPKCSNEKLSVQIEMQCVVCMTAELHDGNNVQKLTDSSTAEKTNR